MDFYHLLRRSASQARRTVHRTMATQTNATVTQISKHLEVHQYHPDTIDSGGPRPTVVFLPWMNATQSQANRYRELYATRGFNVLTVRGNLSYFLWPQWAMPLATELADFLKDETRGPLLVHSMSVGAYLYAVTLSVISDNPDKYSSLVSRVKGHVYDSIVVGTLEEMARGVGLIAAPKSTILQQAISRSCLLYFAATKRHTVLPYNRFIDMVHNSPFKTPKLCFYSRNDVMCLPEAMERLMNHWRNDYGLDVTAMAWENSPHASHLRTDPETYNTLLNEYLKKVGLDKLPLNLSSKL
ncbi:uncharacterized protein LOC121414905 [Lytechinus variegatus]|uniref:uncharacterized protein LOC121414905 n=1 Tax=Lytechinus variegatus TaxID=7654 RepID=UPI001BB15542|nr:uncharacterized protein LOC121414905 [Lytechinus variegatus]